MPVVKFRPVLFAFFYVTHYFSVRAPLFLFVSLAPMVHDNSAGFDFNLKIADISVHATSCVVAFN